MILAVLAIILTLILVVGLHEAGHAIAAYFLNIKIRRISIGFGPPLVQWTSKSGCEWVWAMWPLGGYVQLLNSRIRPVPESDYPFCFDKKPIISRILVLIAGVVANLITAWCAFILIFSIGMHSQIPQVESVAPNSLAALSGIHSGDQLLAMDSQLTPSWQEIGMSLIVHWGSPDLVIQVKNNQQEIKELHVNLSQIHFAGRERSLLTSLGIIPNLKAPRQLIQSPSLEDAIHKSTQTTLHLVYFFLMVLKQLFSGVIPFSMLLGPLGLFAASIVSLSQGLVVFMYFIASFSVAVAVVNLFPLPGLDGGSILYAMIEKIRGKPISIALEVLLYQLTFILFCMLLVHLIMNDVQRFFA